MEDLPELPAENFHRLRLRVDVDRPDSPPLDVLRYALLTLPRAVPIRFELGFFEKNELLGADAIAEIAAVRIQIKAQAAGGGPPAASAAALASGETEALDDTLTVAEWRTDTGVHAVIEIAASGDLGMAFAAPVKARGWLIISLKYAAAPDVWVARSFAPLGVLESGQTDPST